MDLNNFNFPLILLSLILSSILFTVNANAPGAEYCLHFNSKSSMLINGFADADWGADLDDRISTSGYCVFLGSNLISWSSNKQNVVSRSSSEVEYRSIASVTYEIIWIQNLLSELGIKLIKPSVIWNDNLSAVALSHNPTFHSRTKHFELDLHFIREKVMKKLISVQHIPGVHQIADTLTKPLTGQFFTRFRNKPSQLKPTHQEEEKMSCQMSVKDVEPCQQAQAQDKKVQCTNGAESAASHLYPLDTTVTCKACMGTAGIHI